MNFAEAISILKNRNVIQNNTTDTRAAADTIIQAVRLIVNETMPFVITPTESSKLSNWIESGDYTGNETARSLAAQWDATQRDYLAGLDDEEDGE